MTIEDAIRTACREHGRIYGPMIIEEYGYSSASVYAELRRNRIRKTWAVRPFLNHFFTRSRIALMNSPREKNPSLSASILSSAS